MDHRELDGHGYKEGAFSIISGDAAGATFDEAVRERRDAQKKIPRDEEHNEGQSKLRAHNAAAALRRAADVAGDGRRGAVYC